MTFLRPAAVAAVVLSLLAPAAGLAEPAVSADAILARMEAADPGLESYRAAVEFSVGLHTFPFLHKTVHGDAYFKRPDRLEIVFSDLPSYARGMRHVFVGLGTPRTWDAKFAIEVADAGGSDEHLVLIPKRAGRLRDVVVYVDPASSLPVKMIWRYHDGRVEMHQSIVPVGGHYVIQSQEADLKLPGVHAYMRSRVHDFTFNVPIDEKIFTQAATLAQ